MENDRAIMLENNGEVSGAMVGINTGTINISTVVKMPSLISSVVKPLSDLCSEEEDDLNLDLVSFKTEEKLEYNCVIKYKEMIDEYSTYYTICDSLMNTIDDANVQAKKKIQKCVRTWYLECKGQILLDLKEEKASELEKIRANADLIIDRVIDKIRNVVTRSRNAEEITHEEISIGIACFTCYCFMECKILEKPK